MANLTRKPVSLAALELGGREAILSTEDPRYGGSRLSDHSWERMLPHELLIFGGGGRP